MASTPSGPAVHDEAADPGGPVATGPKTRFGGLSRAVRIRQSVLLGSFVVMVLFFYLQRPDTFLSTVNIQNLINGLPVLTGMAVAVTIVLVLGEFDLSVPNVAELASLVVAIGLTQGGVPFLLALLLGLLVGLIPGLVNGLAVGYGKASAFIVTLAIGSIVFGFELVVQGNIKLGASSILPTALPDSLQKLSTGHFLGLELAVWVFLVITILIGLVMAYTPWGRHVQAIGGNETAARLAGVAVRRTKVIAFTLTGVLAAVAGILFTARNGYFAQSLPQFLLPAYAAAFFGAASIGRRGFSVGATVFGALYLAVLANGLTVMNQPVWVASVVQGFVLFVAVLVARSGSSS